MKVMVFAEDPRLDQYMLKPIVKAALKFAGKPRAKVVVCQDSSQRGDTTVIGEEPISELIEDYQGFDAFILCVDRDCREGRQAKLLTLENAIRKRFPGKEFVAVCGIEELEVWVLAGMTDLGQQWAEVRAECHPKETYFDAYVNQSGVADTPGKGRKVLGERAAKEYGSRLRSMCPEVQACELAG